MHFNYIHPRTYIANTLKLLREEEIDLLGRNMLNPAQLPVDPDDEDPVDPEGIS